MINQQLQIVGQMSIFDFNKNTTEDENPKQTIEKTQNVKCYEEQNEEIKQEIQTYIPNIEKGGIIACDNCGGIPRIEEHTSQDPRITIVCECGMESVRNLGAWVDLSETKQEAIDHWNKGYRHKNTLYNRKRTHKEMFKWDFDKYKDCPQMLSMFQKVLHKPSGKTIDCYYQIERPRAGWRTTPIIQVNEKKNGYVFVHSYQTINDLIEEWSFPELETWARGQVSYV